MPADSFTTGIQFQTAFKKLDKVESKIVFDNEFTAKTDFLIAGRAPERFDVPGDAKDQ